MNIEKTKCVLLSLPEKTKCVLLSLPECGSSSGHKIQQKIILKHGTIETFWNDIRNHSFIQTEIKSRLTQVMLATIRSRNFSFLVCCRKT
jgi:hypothetical protein